MKCYLNYFITIFQIVKQNSLNVKEKKSDNNELIGRSYNFVLDIDANVILSVNCNNDLKNYIGKFVDANISFADDYYFFGETIKLYSFFKLI